MRARRFPSQLYFSVPDVLILLLVGALIYAVVSVAHEWRAEYRPVTYIDLSFWALPRYTMFSAARGAVAYFFSLGFTLIFGYWAAKSKTAEKIILPLLDIGQSIPALGFLPGVSLALIALFPNSNVGLELTAIMIIFTSQVWNMAFSLYGSIKAIPAEMTDASTMIGLSWFQRLRRVELPFGAVDLAWNSVVSMAGGWFFLGVCEAFTLGQQEYRLPGIGAYMAVAIDHGDRKAMIAAIIAMTLLIVVMDFIIWRPILAWVRRFRVEDVPGVSMDDPFMGIVFRESQIVRWLKVVYRQYLVRKLKDLQLEQRMVPLRALAAADDEDEEAERSSSLPVPLIRGVRRIRKWVRSPLIAHLLRWGLMAALIWMIGNAIWKLILILMQVSGSVWIILLRDTVWSMGRVILSIVLGTLWTVPVGVWLGISAKRLRVAQPIIQVLASFPAPMLYPLAVAALFKLGLPFDAVSVVLMLLGVQWYILFNILAGALKIPMELDYALSLMRVSRWEKWKTLYLPSIFPNLINGWVIGAGGAWNASIVAEYLNYDGKILRTGGLGSTITAGAAAGDIPVLAASLTLMVAIVLLTNRLVWARIYHLSQTRFKLES